MTRLLVVSSDSRWRFYLEHGLGTATGIEVASIDDCATALHELQGKSADHFGAILVDGAAPTGRSQDEVEHEIDSFVTRLRGAKKGESGKTEVACNLPVLLWSSYPTEGLSRIAGRFESTRLLANDAYETIGAALTAVTAKSGKGAEYASVELEIGPASLSVLASVDGKGVIAQISHTSAWRPDLEDLEEKFRTWALWQRNEGQQPRYTDYWSATFKEAGQRLADKLDYEQIRGAISECLEHVNELHKIHFRFSLLASEVDATFPYVNVPFELLYDTVKKDFIRSLAPVARRLRLKADQRTGIPLPGTRTFSQHLLFVKSNAHGSCEIPGTLFGGKQQLVLPPLDTLDREFEDVQRTRTSTAVEKLELEAGADCMQALQDKLQSHVNPEVVHFSGHSVRADDGSVYLILPGKNPGELRPLAVSDFAVWARQAQVELVLLSSCLSSTPDSVFRLAQVGIPAVVGFRWEVEENEAAYFTGHLHRELAKKAPLARAFHAAISAVRRDFPGSPTFASPMLVVQNDEWTS
jgi:CHAT domain